MIKIIVSRNGMLEGVSIVPTRNVHNPYFLFGVECTEENQLKLKGYMDKADEIWKKIKSTAKGGVIPDYTLRTLLLWQNIRYGAISYPEVGCIPGVQSYLMCLFTAIALDNPDKEIKIITTSEYMVRTSQLLVAHGILNNESIQVYDTESNGKPQPLEFQLPDELSVIKQG